MKIQVLKKNDFPADAFFDHLLKGTEFYQSHDFARAVEEWGAATRMNFSGPVYLKIVEGRIFCGSMIEEVPFLFFLYAIYINQATGTGLIKSEEVSEKFVFIKGNIVSAASSSKKNRIGSYILKRKLLTSQELDKQAVEAKEKKKKLGSHLAEKGYISLKALNEILTLQIQEIIANSLFWKKGLFYFVEKPVNEEIIVKYTPLKGALIAAQRGFNFTHFKKEIADNRTIFRHSPYFLESKNQIITKLNANEEFVLSLIDGVRNIDQIIKFIGADEVSLMNIMYRLSTMGLIRKTKEIGEYEDREFKELSGVLKVLLDIHELITRKLQYELGSKSGDIIQKAKDKLTTTNQMLFENIPLHDPESVDSNMILRNIASCFPSSEDRLNFVDAFYEIYKHIMDEAKLFLGIGLVKEMINKIKTLKADMETFSEDTPSKKRAVKILAELIERY